jgi:hypothetical protein
MIFKSTPEQRNAARKRLRLRKDKGTDEEYYRMLANEYALSWSNRYWMDKMKESANENLHS